MKKKATTLGEEKSASSFHTSAVATVKLVGCEPTRIVLYGRVKKVSALLGKVYRVERRLY